MKYQITLTLAFEQTFEVEAESEADAAQFAYDNFNASEADCLQANADVCEVCEA